MEKNTRETTTKKQRYCERNREKCIEKGRQYYEENKKRL